MKSITELTDFYYNELYPSLKELEEQRLQMVWKIKLYGSFWFIFSSLILIYILKQRGFIDPIFFLFLFGTIILGGVIYDWFSKDYHGIFKTTVIAPIVRAIDPSLLYNPGFPIAQSLFERSGLFRHSIDYYNGNDYVKGTIEGTELEFSDVHAEYDIEDAKGRKHRQTLFKGLFIVSGFNKHFKGKTIILPDSAENNFGSLLGGWLQSMNFSRGDLVRMDDPEFEKYFAVYSNDQIEARYILSHSMMKRITDLRKRLNVSLYISFISNHMHVAIETRRDHFEPNVFTSLLDYQQTSEYVRTLQNTIGLIEELKLNEKLWSKE